MNQYEATVAQIESGSLIADEEDRIELPNNDSYLRLAIDNEVILIKNNGKIYVYFYTSTLMLNNSTGYLKQVALAENTVQEETDINILEKYKGQWYKGATY